VGTDFTGRATPRRARRGPRDRVEPAARRVAARAALLGGSRRL